MAAVTKNILIFGATGLIGTYITNAIVASSSKFGRIAIFTSANTVSTKSEFIDSLKVKGVEIIAGDVTSTEDVNNAYKGIDTVVSAVGRAVITTQIQLIELADKHPDVKRFFPSEYGTDIEYSPHSKDEPPHQQKLKVRATFKKVTDLEYTYVVTGPYGDAGGLYLSPPKPNYEAAGFYDVKGKRAGLIEDGNKPVSLTPMRDVGKLVVAALLHPEAAKNRALIVNSFTATPNEIVKEFERQTGDKWDVTYTPLTDLKEREKDAWANKDPLATVYTLRRIWAEGGTLYEHRDNGLIECDDLNTLESAVAKAIEVQTGSAAKD